MDDLPDVSLSGKPKWLDRIHDYVNDGVYDSAVWFDNFFGDERSEEESLPGTFIRFKLDTVFTERQETVLRRRLHFDIRLPKAEDKLRLVFTNQREDDFSEIGARDIADANYSTGGLKLRYNAIESLLDNFSINVGWVNLELRYRYLHLFTENINGRVTQTAFWDDDEGFGGNTRFDLEMWPKQTKLYRWSTRFKYTEDLNGIEAGTVLTYFEQLTRRTGLSANMGVYGITSPETAISNYNLGLSYRRNFYRRWLFFEIIPEHNWPRQEDGRHLPEWKCTVRFEVQFAHMEDKAYQ